jgi:isoleucyl-tRNA synthetase
LVVDHLRESGHLFRDEKFSHSYPHDWRGKTPTIFRATEQWFISVDKAYGSEEQSLRARALEAAESAIEFVPDWGRARMRGMLESRPDWCISRQRSWGLPIPAFYCKSGEALLTVASVNAVAAFVREHGSDSWFTEDSVAILAHYDPATDQDAPASLRDSGKAGLADLSKGTDIFDVWFESGSSWNAVMRERDIGFPCDLYLEGSDQHRGWFQVSLLLSLGMMGESPYREVLTHGFMVTAQGQKMSKSLGNAIEVEDLLKQHGADICRWWTASLNYTYDIKADWEFFKVASDEYRKVRNTIRFMLGNLADFNPERDRYVFCDDDAGTIDAWAMTRLSELVSVVREGYVTYRFKRVVEALFDFCNDTMSAVYLAAVKDRLYCDAQDAPRRRRTQTVLYDTARALIRMLAPILVHTSDEAWAALDGAGETSDACVHLEYLPEAFEWRCDESWDEIMVLRGEVLKQLELAKEDQGISNPMNAGVEVLTDSDQAARLQPFLDELVDLVGVSRFTLEGGDEPSITIGDLREEPRCERSWKRDGTVRPRSDGGLLSDRDAAVVGVE